MIAVSTRPELTERLVDEIGAFLRRTRTSAIRVADRVGLQPTQSQILFTLKRLGECRVADLAEVQLVDPSVSSRQVAAMEKAGLVERRPDPEDARASLVSLSQAGHAKLGEVHAEHRAALATALAGWPDERITRLADDLREFVEASGPVYDELTGPRAGQMEVV